MINLVAISVALFTLILSLVCFFVFNVDTGLSCLFGGALMMINMLGLALLWRLIFSKKSIALAILVIIFKFLILGLILWNLRQAEWIKPIGFVLGLSSLVLGILGFSVYKKFFLNS
jgi:hypothetical protein